MHAIDGQVADVLCLLLQDRLLQIAIARIRQTTAGQEADINEVAATVVRRIRVVKVNSVAAFQAKYDVIVLWIRITQTHAASALYLVTSRFKDVQSVTHLLQIKLLIVDCVTALYVKVFCYARDVDTLVIDSAF